MKLATGVFSVLLDMSLFIASNDCCGSKEIPQTSTTESISQSESVAFPKKGMSFLKLASLKKSQLDWRKLPKAEEESSVSSSEKPKSSQPQRDETVREVGH